MDTCGDRLGWVDECSHVLGECLPHGNLLGAQLSD